MAFKLATKTIGDYDDAKDLVQEVFVYLYERLQLNQKIEHYSSWIYRATFNKCLDYIKKNNKYDDLEKVQLVAYDDDTVSRNETKIWIDKALRMLKPNERFLVVLYSEGLSYKEMAEITGMNFTSVGKTLSRILKKMEKELKTKQYELFG